MPSLVHIYEVSKEWSTHVWLCDPCAEVRRERKWRVGGKRLPPPRVFAQHIDPAGFCNADLDDREPIACQDCHLRAVGIEPC